MEAAAFEFSGQWFHWVDPGLRRAADEGGGGLEARLDCLPPAVGEFLETPAARMVGLAAARDSLAELGEPALAHRAIRGLARTAKLLAVTFDEGIVNAR